VGVAAHGNTQLAELFATIAHERPHPRRQQQRVIDVFNEERSHLLSLPEPLPETDRITPVAVDKQAFVKLNTNRYSVPSSYAHRCLSLVVNDQTVRVLDGADEIAHHPRSWARNQCFELHEHRASILQDKRRARDPKGRDRLRLEVPQIDALFSRWVEAGRNIGSMVAFTIRLLDAYGPAMLRDVVGDMNSRGLHDRGAMAILCEQRGKRHDGPAALALTLGKHVVERDVIAHNLGDYDD